MPFSYLLPSSAGSNEILEVGKFSASSIEDELPSNWESFAFKRIKKHTGYTLVKDNGIAVVKASSNRSASGLILKIKIDITPPTSLMNKPHPLAAGNFILAL